MKRFSHLSIITTIVFLWVASCTPGTTAADKLGTFDDMGATARADQYRRDAQATVTHAHIQFSGTQTQSAINVERNMQSIKLTDTQVAVLARTAGASATASANAATATASVTQMTATAVASAATATANTSNTIATASQAAVITATAIANENARATANFYNVLSVSFWFAITMFILIAIAAGILFVQRKGETHIKNEVKRGSAVKHGANNTQTVMVLDGDQKGVTVINTDMPLPAVRVDSDGNVTSPLAQLTPEMLERVLTRVVEMMMVRAMHNPFPPPDMREYTEREKKSDDGGYERLKISRPAAGNRHAPALSPNTVGAMLTESTSAPPPIIRDSQSEIIEGEVREAKDDGEVAAWIDEVQYKLLEAGHDTND